MKKLTIRKRLGLTITSLMLLCAPILSACNCDWQKTQCPIQVVEKSLLPK
jgi:hypothetical protein